jgi:hypothetical protein
MNIMGKHVLINFIDTKAKCRHLNNLRGKDVAAGVNLTEAPSPPMTPILPPAPYTLYTCIILYTYLHSEGGGG